MHGHVFTLIALARARGGNFLGSLLGIKENEMKANKTRICVMLEVTGPGER